MTGKKIALVTGANKGLGFETSRQLAQLGIKVLLDGAKTGVALATLDSDGPTGGFFHMGETMPW